MHNTPAPARRCSPVVIVVEDDEGLRVALLRMLRASGFRVRAHDCGEALLEDERSDEADCLVVDVHLPAMSGLDLVERLRQRGLNTPAVAISAHGGLERFLGKPFLGSVLVSTVNELLAERGASAEPGKRGPSTRGPDPLAPKGRGDCPIERCSPVRHASHSGTGCDKPVRHRPDRDDFPQEGTP